MRKLLKGLLITILALLVMPTISKAAEFIDKIELNYEVSSPYSDAMSGSDARRMTSFSVVEGTNISKGNNNKYFYQCPTAERCTEDIQSFYSDRIVAGHYSYMLFEIYAEEFGMDIENPSYDFDKDNLSDIEIWVNGVKRDDAYATNYNDSWRCVDVMVPVEVIEYTGPKYTVTFNTNGGGTIESQLVAENYYAVEPTKPTKPEWIFTYWYKDEELTERFYFNSDPITSNITLYAGYRPEVVTQMIDKIEINYTSSIPFVEGTTGNDIRGAISYSVDSEAPYSKGNNNIYLMQCPTIERCTTEYEGKYNDPVEYGKYTYLLIEIYAKEFGLDVVNPTYDFDKDHLEDIDILINGQHVDGTYISDYNNSWREVDVMVPISIIKYNPVPKATISASNSTLTIDWNEINDATKYEVYRSTSKTKGYKKVATPTTNTYKNSGLTYGKTYYYKVRAYYKGKWTSYSNIVSKKVVPNKVENLRLTTRGVNSLKVSWDKIGVSGYQLQRSTNNKKWTTVKTITKNSTLNYNNTKLSANKTYYYRIRAYKKVGSKKVYGAWSTVLVTKTAPSKPTLKLSMKDFKEVNITIGKVSGVNKYIVEKSTDGTTYSLLEELPNSGVLANADLETGNRYYYRVRACNGEICSPWATSSIVSSTKTPSHTLKTSSKKVTVTVSRVNGATGYEIYRATRKSGKYTKVKTILDEEELLEYINSTTKGRTYYYKVRSYVELESMKVYSSYSGIKSIKSK